MCSPNVHARLDPIPESRLPAKPTSESHRAPANPFPTPRRYARNPFQRPAAHSDQSTTGRRQTGKAPLNAFQGAHESDDERMRLSCARLSGPCHVLKPDLHLSRIHAFRHRRRDQLAKRFAECFLSLRLRLRMDRAGGQVPDAQPVDQAAHAFQSVFRTEIVLKSVAQVESPPTADPVPFKVGPRFQDRKRLVDELHHIGVSFRPQAKCCGNINRSR